jgi:hypothetical protein
VTNTASVMRARESIDRSRTPRLLMGSSYLVIGADQVSEQALMSYELASKCQRCGSTQWCRRLCDHAPQFLKDAVSYSPTVQNTPVSHAHVEVDGQKRRDYIRNDMRKKRAKD